MGGGKGTLRGRFDWCRNRQRHHVLVKDDLAPTTAFQQDQASLSLVEEYRFRMVAGAFASREHGGLHNRKVRPCESIGGLLVVCVRFYDGIHPPPIHTYE